MGVSKIALVSNFHLPVLARSCGLLKRDTTSNWVKFQLGENDLAGKGLNLAVLG